jgi:PAS domain S-box-containing protein
MMTQDLQEEVAFCEVNEHGRLLNANKRFCRLFGFDENDVAWHYVKDLYRHDKDWDAYQKCSPERGSNIRFVARLKNRKGRSFKCSISRDVYQDDSGRIIYRNRIQKVLESSKDTSDILTGPSSSESSFVYLAKCVSCAKQLKISASHRDSRLPIYCPECAAVSFSNHFQSKEIAL